MRLFKPKRTPEEKETLHDGGVEVVVAKEATKDVIKKAKEANQHLQDLLNQNNFHIKIYIAAGGRKPKGAKR